MNVFVVVTADKLDVYATEKLAKASMVEGSALFIRAVQKRKYVKKADATVTVLDASVGGADGTDTASTETVTEDATVAA